MEKLRVKNLGPIKDFEMETNRLTVLIGPQASGKSLMAQMLYFYRGMDALLAEQLGTFQEEAGWEGVLSRLLNDMRGVDFGYFVGDKSRVIYSLDGRQFDILFQGRGLAKKLTLGKELKTSLDVLFQMWPDNKSEVRKRFRGNQVYIPTERILFSLVGATKPSMLYADFMPYVLRKFADKIDEASLEYANYLTQRSLFSEINLHVDLVAKLQKSALGGSIMIREKKHLLNSPMAWGWSVVSDDNAPMPINATSSGQMEAWPFFVLATVFGGRLTHHDFYFEEPETHLHPNAQVEVVKTIAYLISRGHRFVITTHSPFILYVINNLIQAHIAYDGKPPEGEFSIDPDHVAAYCMGEKPHSIVDKETKLLDLDEIDDVFDDIGEYFQTMLEKAYEKRLKK